MNGSGPSADLEAATAHSQASPPGSSHLPREVGSTVVLNVYLPELEVRRRHEFDVDENLWFAKIRLLASLDESGPRDGLNCSFYLPPANGRAGKFLDDERPLRDYPLSAGDFVLEFKHKRRVYRQPNVNRSKLQRLHTRENFKLLINSVKSRALDKITKLLSKGLDPNFHDADSGETPLTTAATQPDCHSIVATLVGTGSAHLDFRNRQSLTPMHVAAACGNADAITVLLELGASPNSKDRKGLTPLFYLSASRLGSVPCAELLLRDFATVGCQDQLGYTELHQACKNGHLQLAEMLAFYGADMNARNSDGFTPLHSSVAANQIPCLKMLLSRGANRQVADLSGHTPLQAARLLSKLEAAAVLEEFDDSQLRPFTETPQYNQRRRLTGSNLEVLRKLAESDARLSASSASLLNRDSLASASRPSAASAGRTTSMSRSYHSVRCNADFYDGDDGLEHWTATGSRASLGHLSLYLPRERQSLTDELNEVLGMRSDDGQRSRSFRNGESSSFDGSYTQATVRASVAAGGHHSDALALAPEKSKATAPGAPSSGQQIGIAGGTGSPKIGASVAGGRDSRIRAVVLVKGKKGFGFVLRGAKAAQLKKMAEPFEPSDRAPALQYLDTVEPGSAAEKAGLQAGDFILELGGVDVARSSHEDLVHLIKESGSCLSMKVISSLAAPRDARCALDDADELGSAFVELDERSALDHLDKTLASYESQTVPAALPPAATANQLSNAKDGKHEAAVAAAADTAAGGSFTSARHQQQQQQQAAAVASSAATTRLASIRSRPPSQLFAASVEMEAHLAAGSQRPSTAADGAAAAVGDGQRKPSVPPPPPPRGPASGAAVVTTKTDSTSADRRSSTASTNSSSSGSAALSAAAARAASAATMTGGGSRSPEALGDGSLAQPSSSQATPATAATSAGAALSQLEETMASSVGDHPNKGFLPRTPLPQQHNFMAASRQLHSPPLPPPPPPPPTVLSLRPAPPPPPPLLPSSDAVPLTSSVATFKMSDQRPEKGSHGSTFGNGTGLTTYRDDQQLPSSRSSSIGSAASLTSFGDNLRAAVAAVAERRNNGLLLADDVPASTDNRRPNRDEPDSRSLESELQKVLQKRQATLQAVSSASQTASAPAAVIGGSYATEAKADAAAAAAASGPKRHFQHKADGPQDIKKGSPGTNESPEPLFVASAPAGAAEPRSASGPFTEAAERMRTQWLASRRPDQQSVDVAVIGASGGPVVQSELAEQSAAGRTQSQRVSSPPPPSLLLRSPTATEPAVAATVAVGGAKVGVEPLKKPPPPPVPAKKVTVRTVHLSMARDVSAPTAAAPVIAGAQPGLISTASASLPATAPTARAASGEVAASGAGGHLEEPGKSAAGVWQQPLPLPPTQSLSSRAAESVTATASAATTASVSATAPAASTASASTAASAVADITEHRDSRPGDDLDLPPPPPPHDFGVAAEAADECFVQADSSLPLPPPLFDSGPAEGPQKAAAAELLLPSAPSPHSVTAEAVRAVAAAIDSVKLDTGLPYVDKRVDAWSVTDVGDWLSSLGLGEYRAAFADNCVDGESLVNLTRDDVKELGMDKVGHRVKFEKEVKKLSQILATKSSDA